MAEKLKVNQMSLQELQNTLQDSKEELRNLRFNTVIGQAANAARPKVVRRTIARIRTVMNEYKLGLRKSPEKKGS